MILCCAGLAAPAGGQEAAPHRAPHVPWLEDAPWAEVLKQAREVSLPILIDFHASWCGPCKALDAMVYNEAEVIRELADVLTLKVDVDRPDAEALEKEFGVTRLPTLIYCDSEGQRWGSFTGFVSADTFLARVRQWKRSLSGEREFLARLETAPDDPVILMEAFNRSKGAGRSAEAAGFRERLLTLTRPDRRHEAARQLVIIATNEFLSGSADEAQDLIRRTETMFPADGQDLGRDLRLRDLESLANLTGLQEQLPDTLGLLETYSHMIKLDRGYVPALEGFARTALAGGIRLPQATTCALRAVIRSDNRPDLLALLAACYQRRSFHARAVKWMEKAVAAAPDNLEFHDRLGLYRSTCPPWMRPPDHN